MVHDLHVSVYMIYMIYMYTVHDLHVYSTRSTCLSVDKFQMNNVLLVVQYNYAMLLKQSWMKWYWGFGWIFATSLARWWTVKHCWSEDKSLANQWSMQLTTWVCLCKILDTVLPKWWTMLCQYHVVIIWYHVMIMWRSCDIKWSCDDHVNSCEDQQQQQAVT